MLCKGKRTDNGEWVEGYFVKYQPCASEDKFIVGIVPEYASALYIIEVIPESVKRCTGLTDRNDRRIFEDDVLSVKDNGKEKYRFIVRYGNFGGVPNAPHRGYVGFYLSEASKIAKRCMIAGMRGDILYWLGAYECEVTDNVHDNPKQP